MIRNVKMKEGLARLEGHKQLETLLHIIQESTPTDN